MTCLIHPDKVIESDCHGCPTCYLERLMTEPLPSKRGLPLPVYECCGAPILFRPSDHHRCRNVRADITQVGPEGALPLDSHETMVTDSPTTGPDRRS